MECLILVTNCLALDQPTRSGGEFAKYAMMYSIIYYGVSRLGTPDWIKSIGSSFAASFLCGCRNGRDFGFKSGVGGARNALINDIINRIKKH